MVCKDCCGSASGYFCSKTISESNDATDFFDSNGNYIVRNSMSPKRNVSTRLDTINEYENELSLLEELEVNPDQIKERAILMLMLNLWASDDLIVELFLTEIDLFGPMCFCFIFGFCLFLAGKMFVFGNIYGMSMVSILGIYALLRLLCDEQQDHFITIKGVAAALGYGMLHLIWLSFIGIFMRLNAFDGFALAALAVGLATVGVSRILNLMSNLSNSRELIAYPIAMIYVLFAFFVMF